MVRQLWAFIGLASYYQWFIKRFASIAWPLYCLLQNDVKYEWGKEQNGIFETLKNYLTTTLILQYLNFDYIFYLHTGTSGTGLCAVLTQKENKKKHAISYASQSLTVAKRNYSTKQEYLAVLWAIEHYHYYFGFKPFVVVKDYSALKWLQTFNLKSRKAR